MASLTSLNFLITGAGRGIGRGLSRILLQTGHRVFLVDNDRTELDNTSNMLSKTYQRGKQFESSLCDVRQLGDIREVAAKAEKLFDGKLDCLVNNAAYTKGVGGLSLAEMTLEEWNKSLETNLTGPMLMTQACLSMLRSNDTVENKQDDGTTPSTTGAGRKGGCVIHMSSTRAFMSEANNEAYSTTKAGLVGLTQSMAVSLGSERDRIRVNCILPGWIHVADECYSADERGTEWQNGLSEDDMRWQLTGRVGKVEDIARAVLYLVESDGVTGAEVVVDGGVTRKMVYPE